MGGDACAITLGAVGTLVVEGAGAETLRAGA